MLQEIILSVIISIDTFLAAVAYRSCGIRIPFGSALVISFMSALFLGISLALAALLSNTIPDKIYAVTGLIIPLSMGISTIYKSLVRNLVRRLSQRGELSLHTRSSGIVIKLYLDDTAADVDNSKVLTPTEAAALAIGSSLDSLCMGLSLGNNSTNPAISFIFAMLVGVSAIILGGFMGKKICGMSRDFSWIGGAALIIFGIFEFTK